MPVNELYFDFVGGKVSGDISGCNAAELADALMAIVAALQVEDYTPAYIGYDEGKISSG